MSGRKQRATRKTTKRPKEAKGEGTPIPVFFEDVLLAFLRKVGETVGGIKSRSGAQSLGPVAVSVCATEALDVARNSGRPQDYISASAYALVAAMQQGRAWNLPPKPAPPSEQAPESQEKPPEPSKPKGKGKGRGKDK